MQFLHDDFHSLSLVCAFFLSFIHFLAFPVQNIIQITFSTHRTMCDVFTLFHMWYSYAKWIFIDISISSNIFDLISNDRYNQIGVLEWWSHNSKWNEIKMDKEKKKKAQIPWLAMKAHTRWLWDTHILRYNGLRKWTNESERQRETNWE